MIVRSKTTEILELSSLRQHQRRVIVALPAYNEEKKLATLLGRIAETFTANQSNYLVVVVDDGSADATAEIAEQASKEMNVRLVKHGKNRGLAGALETCFATAFEEGKEGDVIITMDADDTHPPKIMDRLLRAIDEGYDVAIASRFQPSSRVVGVPFNRVWLAKIASYMFRLMMPIEGVRDYTCGYRAYRYNVLKHAADFHGERFVSETGFSCMVDVLLKMRQFNFIMGEVPFVLRYDWKEGESKMPVGSTIGKTLKLFAKRRMGHM